MEACFNELSLLPLCKTMEEVRNRINNYADVIAEAIENQGFRKIRYEQNLQDILISENETIASYCYKNLRDNNVLLLLATQANPYIGENEDEATEIAYISSTVFYVKETKKIKSEGFAAAYAKNTICMGMLSESCWDKEEHEINICYPDRNETKSWICVSRNSHFCSNVYTKWIDENAPLCLKKCIEIPKRKKIKLRPDHGQDILEAHAKKLIQSPYVVGIINSLPFQPNAKNYIHQVKSDGTIEIVLTDTDKGLGLVVKTTGENLRETKRIAKILQNKYGC